jgi:hypothetical protein
MIPTVPSDAAQTYLSSMYLRAYAQGRKLAAGCSHEVTADDAAYRASSVLAVPLLAIGGIAWLYLNFRYPILFSTRSMPSLACGALASVASIVVYLAVSRRFRSYPVSAELIAKYRSPEERLIRVFEVIFTIACSVVLGVVAARFHTVGHGG